MNVDGYRTFRVDPGVEWGEGSVRQVLGPAAAMAAATFR